MKKTKTEEVNFFDEPGIITDAMKAALARMYVDQDIRAYLIRSVQVANHNAVSFLDVGEEKKAERQANRAKVLKGLLDTGRECLKGVQLRSLKGGANPVKINELINGKN